jgi:hypothetical protein
VIIDLTPGLDLKTAVLILPFRLLFALPKLTNIMTDTEHNCTIFVFSVYNQQRTKSSS